MFTTSFSRHTALMSGNAQPRQKKWDDQANSLLFSGSTAQISTAPAPDQLSLSSVRSNTPAHALFQALWQKNHQQLRKGLAFQPELANAVNPEDQTPILLEAVALGDMTAAALLLESGADSLRPNPEGITPIVWAVASGNAPMVQLLLQNGAPLNSYYHNRPLMHLAFQAQEKTVVMLKALQEAGATVNARDAAKRTPLHIAVEQESPDAAQWLLKSGAELEARDGEGYTPLHRAALQGSESVFALLQQAGADLDTRNNLGLTPYLTAAGAGKVRLMKALQTAGADTQALTQNGLTALHWAAGLNQTETLRHLLSPKHQSGKPLSPNLQAGRLDYTPLHLAVAFQSSEAIEELLRVRKKGASPVDWHIPDRNGHTPRDYAEAHGPAFFDQWRSRAIPAGSDTSLEVLSTPGISQPGNSAQLVSDGTGQQELIELPLPAINLESRGASVQDSMDSALKGEKSREESPKKLAPKTPSGYTKKRGQGSDGEALVLSGTSSPQEQITTSSTASKKTGKARKKGKQPQSGRPQNQLKPGKPEMDEIDEALLAVYGVKPNEHYETFLDLLNHHAETLQNMDEQGKYDFISQHLNAFNINKPYQVALASSSNPPRRVPIEVTPLHVAILSNMNAKWIQLFLEKGGDPTLKDSIGRTPFHLAASTGHVDYLNALTAKGKWSSQFRTPEIWKNTAGNTPLHDAARMGHAEAIQWFLDKKFPVNVKNDHEETPLHLAVKEGHAGVIAPLLKHNANPVAQNSMGRTPLHLAALTGSLDVLKAFADVPKKIFPARDSKAWKTLEGNTPLHEAAKVGHIEWVKWLIDMGFPINESNINQETPLHMAAAGGHTEVAMRLLELGADPNARTKAGMSPLHSATHTLATDTLAALLRSEKFDSNAILVNGSPALHLAVVNHDLSSVRLLLAHGADINQTEDNGRGALHLAAMLNDGAMVDELLKQGADPRQVDAEGENVLHHLLGSRKHHDSKEALGNLNRLLRQVSPDTRREMLKTADKRFQNTPLHMAIALGNVEAVKLLLANGANPTLTNCAGKNGLMAAVDNSYTESIRDIVNLLLSQSDAQVKRLLEGKTTDEEANVLHLAAALNLTEVMNDVLQKQKALAEKGIVVDLNLNARDTNGRTPLHYASLLGKLDAARFLLSQNADPAEQDQDGQSPLMAAIGLSAQANLRNSPEILKISHTLTDEILASIRNQAVDAGKSPHQAVVTAVNQRNMSGYSPLHMAATEGRVTLLKKMLHQGADPTLLNELGGSPLHIAADFENEEVSSQMVEALLEAYYRQGGWSLVSQMVQLKDSLGVTPLQVARLMKRPSLEQRMRHYRPGVNPNDAVPLTTTSDVANAFAKRKVIKVPYIL